MKYAVARVSDEVRAQTGSGRMELDAIQGSVEAHTGSGGVKISTPAQAGFDIRAHTGSGHITVDRPMSVRGTIGHHDLQAKVGGGGSAIVDVSTGSGTIHIQ